MSGQSEAERLNRLAQELARKVLALQAQVEQGTRKLADVVDKAKALDAENEELTKREAALREAIGVVDELVQWLTVTWPRVIREIPTPLMQRLKQASRALSEQSEIPEGCTCGTILDPEGTRCHRRSCSLAQIAGTMVYDPPLSERSANEQWSKGEHLAEARAVEEHQERKHRERDG